jgi:hypothetical protein
MAYNSCGGVKQEYLMSGIGMHFPGLTNLHKRPIAVFPELGIRLSCGKGEFRVPKRELNLLAKSES